MQSDISFIVQVFQIYGNISFSEKYLPTIADGSAWLVHYIVAGVPVSSCDIPQLQIPFAEAKDLVPVSLEYRPCMSVFLTAAFLKHHKFKAL